MVTIMDADPKTTLYTFSHALKANSLFTINIWANELITLEALMAKANKFIDIKEKKRSKAKSKLAKSPRRDESHA